MIGNGLITSELLKKFDELIQADLKSPTEADPLYAQLTAEESMQYALYVNHLSQQGEIEKRIAQRDSETPDKTKRFSI